MVKPDAPRTSLLYSVKRLELVIRARLDELLRDSGVTTLQYTALTVLARHDGVSAAQLARDSFVTPQAMADMVRSLEGRGLVSRAPHPSNRRELRLHLTSAGRDLLARYDDETRALEDRMAADMTPAQREAFRGFLRSARSALDEDVQRS